MGVLCRGRRRACDDSACDDGIDEVFVEATHMTRRRAPAPDADRVGVLDERPFEIAVDVGTRRHLRFTPHEDADGSTTRSRAGTPRPLLRGKVPTESSGGPNGICTLVAQRRSPPGAGDRRRHDDAWFRPARSAVATSVSSCSEATGLVRCASNPASRARKRSSACP